MKKRCIILLLIAVFTNDLSAQNFRNKDTLIVKNERVTVYLLSAWKRETHFFFAEDGKSDIMIDYELRVEKNNGIHFSRNRILTQFIPDSLGRYKIMQTSLIVTRYERPQLTEEDKELGIVALLPRESRRDIRPEPRTSFVGYSDDTTLMDVKILNYINERTPKLTFYKEKKVSKPAAFLSCGGHYCSGNYMLTGDTEKEIGEFIKERFLREYRILPNDLKGTINFSYCINQYGLLTNFKVEKVKINQKQHVSAICGMANQLLNEIRWTPASLNNENVAVKRSFRIKF